MTKAAILNSPPLEADSLRLDDLQNGYFLYQQPETFCFGMDAVLLSAFATLRKNERMLDLCTGNGVIPLLMHARYIRGNKDSLGCGASAHITGIEIQDIQAKLAQMSVAYNKLDNDISIIPADIKKASEYLEPGSFSVITCNPPYMISGHGLENPEDSKAIARHELLCRFDDIASVSARLLKEHGRLYVVHRPFRLPEIMDTLRSHRLEPKRMRLVYPKIDKEANIVLIEAVLGGKPRLKAEKPLIIHSMDGKYTEEIRNIYK